MGLALYAFCAFSSIFGKNFNFMKSLLLTSALFLCLLCHAQKEVNNQFSKIPNKPDDTLRFQAGSCALNFLNKGTFKIFETMGKKKSDFMIWLGDHVYFLSKAHWGSADGMRKAYRKQRSIKPLKSFLSSIPQYAIWDDHEYGPNNSDGDFENKEASLAVFKEMWANPSYGLLGTPGVFFNTKHSDCEFFFTDGRYYAKKWETMFGAVQMAWLKAQLKKSTATFKFVACGSQVFSTGAEECMRKYTRDFEELMAFIKNERIEGVIFMSGDRHFTELSKYDQPGSYPLYDFTCSSLCSPTMHRNANDNIHHVSGTFTKTHNFGYFTVQGPAEDREVHFQSISAKGVVLWERKIKASELVFGK